MKKYIYLFTSFLVGICVGVTATTFFGLQTAETEFISPDVSSASYTYKLESQVNQNSSLVIDQQIKRIDTATGEETITIPSIRAIFPALGSIEKGWVYALQEFARPEGSGLIVFTVGPGGDSDGDGRGGVMVIYDTSSNSFRPVLNQPPGYRILSPNQGYLVAASIDESEVTTLMQYDIINDVEKTLIQLPKGQTFTKNMYLFGGPTTDIKWIDNKTITYSIFSDSPKIDPEAENQPDRVAIKTGTATLK